MNNITIFTFVTLFFFAGSVQAGLWEKITTIGAEIKKPSAEYVIETAGWNTRVYEWIPKDNPNVRCVFATGSQKGGVPCYSIND